MKTGFNLDFSSTRAANAFNANTIKEIGKMEAKRIQAQDRGLERGLGTVLGAGIGFAVGGGASGALKGANLGSSVLSGDTEGVVKSATELGFGDDKKKKKPSQVANTASEMAGVAIDPAQVLSANNALPGDGTEDSDYVGWIKSFF